MSVLTMALDRRLLFFTGCWGFWLVFWVRPPWFQEITRLEGLLIFGTRGTFTNVKLEAAAALEVELVPEVWTKTVTGEDDWVLVAELTMKTGPAVTSFPSLVTD